MPLPADTEDLSNFPLQGLMIDMSEKRAQVPGLFESDRRQHHLPQHLTRLDDPRHRPESADGIPEQSPQAPFQAEGLYPDPGDNPNSLGSVPNSLQKAGGHYTEFISL